MKAEHDALDPRLERYADRTLSEDEVAALEADAATNPALAEALELFRPLGDGARRRLADAALAETSSGARRWWVGGAVVMLAAAAALAIVARPSVAPLPAYQVTAEAGDAEWRGASGPATQTVQAGSEVSIVARPARRVEGPLEAQLWVVAQGRVERSPVTPDVSPDGAVRWLGAAGALAPGRTGPVRLVALVGRPSTLPSVDETTETSEGRGWRAVVVSVVIRPEGASP